MKRIFNLLVITIFLVIFSCGGNNSANTESKSETEESDVAAVKDCDDFLNQYEAWMDNYLELLDKFLNNPGDSELETQQIELMQEAIVWSEKWFALVECADDKKYQDRFKEIELKAEKKLEEIGM